MEFTVTWSIQLDAESHEDAIRTAQAMLADPANTATYFRATDAQGDSRLIDAETIEEED